MKYVRDEHRVHLIIYHLIWCSKRRKKVLVNDISKECSSLIKQKCKRNAWEVLNLTIQPEHVHLFVRVFPTISAAEVIKQCKGITSYHLRQNYPELRKLPCMWTRSYFASTAGNVSAKIIQEYIDAQSKS